MINDNYGDDNCVVLLDGIGLCSGSVKHDDSGSDF